MGTFMRESARARQAWADYLALGPARSLEALLNRYQTVPSAPTRRITTLKQWSADFGWQARLQALADQAAAAAEERERAYRRSILEDGYALAHERVALLKRLAVQLEHELVEGGRLWVTDRKQIGGGEYAQVVEVERFNSAEVSELRALLNDIAQEKGERARRVDVEVHIRQQAEQLAAQLGDGTTAAELIADAESFIRRLPRGAS
jgi:hypothetical protein